MAVEGHHRGWHVEGMIVVYVDDLLTLAEDGMTEEKHPLCSGLVRSRCFCGWSWGEEERGRLRDDTGGLCKGHCREEEQDKVVARMAAQVSKPP